MNNQKVTSSARQAEERYRLLVDAIVDYAVYMLDPTGTVISWNPGAERFKGYTASEIIGAHFSVFYTEPDRQSGLPARGLETALTNGRFETEGWRVRKDGTHFWAHVVIDPIRTVDGELIGFAKVTRDLTDKKLAEDALRESEAQLRLLIEGVKDYAIYLISPDGLVTNWNAGAQRIKGYHPNEVIGQHFGLFYTAEDRVAGKPEANLALAARDGRLEEEGWRLRKDGTLFMAHVVIHAVCDQSGTLTGFAKVTRDVTERYETQKALDKAREELFQAQKMEAVGRLTGGVAHDFNNLLAIILGNLQLARKRLSDPRIAHLIDNAIVGAERGASMTQRMLAFSRKQPLQLAAVAVPDLVFGMNTLIKQSIGTTVAIDTKFPLDLPSVYADGHQLEMALLNLVLNARDAMPNGGNIFISAWLHQERGDGPAAVLNRSVVIEVKDSGDGMDEQTLAQAVDPFFTTKGVGKGTGLGLSMVHGFVEQLNGKLKLQSTKGEGTTVQLWLPTADSAKPNSRSEEQKPVIPSARSMRILLVDEDDLVLQSTSALLEELGHQPLQARSVRDAMQMLEGGNIELAIIDSAIPRITLSPLVELLTNIRPELPIIYACGYADSAEGVDMNTPRLSKPFNETGLALVISQTMSNRLSTDTAT
jgi:PAS domain S-box-containing protein